MMEKIKQKTGEIYQLYFVCISCPLRENFEEASITTPLKLILIMLFESSVLF